MRLATAAARPPGRLPAAAPPARARTRSGLHRPRAACLSTHTGGSVWWLEPLPARAAEGASTACPPSLLSNLATAARRLLVLRGGADDGAAPGAALDAAPTLDGAALWADPAFRSSLLHAGCEPAAGCPGMDPPAPPSAPPLRVALLLSGGVDSAVAAALLQAAGHTVIPFYLKIWFEEDFRNTWDACPWEADLADAGAVCARLGLPPPTVVPLTGAYWDRVVADCVRELRAGRTPNPDVLCNSRVKYGAFVEWLRAEWKGGGEGGGGGGGGEGGGGAARAPAHPLGDSGFDRVATGHYARVVRGGGGDASTPPPPGPVRRPPQGPVLLPRPPLAVPAGRGHVPPGGRGLQGGRPGPGGGRVRPAQRGPQGLAGAVLPGAGPLLRVCGGPPGHLAGPPPGRGRGARGGRVAPPLRPAGLPPGRLVLHVRPAERHRPARRALVRRAQGHAGQRGLGELALP